MKLRLKEKIQKLLNIYFNNESFDVLINFIDLQDKTLKREEIIQIYKDAGNEKRYFLRSKIQLAIKSMKFLFL